MTDAVTINLPELPVQLLPTVSQFTVLRALPSITLLTGDDYLVNGNDAVGDAGGGVFVWNAASTRDDNDRSIIKPDDLGPLQAGRWVLLADPSPQLAAAASALANATGSGLVGFSQSATYPTGSIGAHELNFICVTDAPYNAKGDGTTDDTAAFKAAIDDLAPGSTLYLGNGLTFKLSASLIFTKPINIAGSGMEKSVLMFASGGTYQALGDGTKAAMIFLHQNTVLPGSSVTGDARRSVPSNFKISTSASGQANLRGLVTCAPIYPYQIWSEYFTLDGQCVVASDDIDTFPVKGVANGTVFTNCISYRCGRHGFNFQGNNANACKVSRCHGFENGGDDFHDDSLSGQNYEACETQGSTGAGYYSNPANPIVSLYLGDYSETAVHYSISPRSMIIAPKGNYKPTRTSGGVVFAGLPSRSAYLSVPMRVATTDDIAEAMGGPAAPGAAAEFGEEGYRIRWGSGEGLTSLIDTEAAGYVTHVVNDIPAMRVAKTHTTGNLNGGTLWPQQGIVFSGSGRSGIMGGGPTAPTTGTYAVGAIWLHENPFAGGWIGWVCVAAGTPGTWKLFGAIDA